MDGLRIVSDGTVEGTALVLDGHPLSGQAHVTWEFNQRKGKARLVMEFESLTAVSGHDEQDFAALTDVDDPTPGRHAAPSGGSGKHVPGGLRTA